MHHDDTRSCRSPTSRLLSAKLLKNGTLKVYEKFTHGMCTTHAEMIKSHHHDQAQSSTS